MKLLIIEHIQAERKFSLVFEQKPLLRCNFYACLLC